MAELADTKQEKVSKKIQNSLKHGNEGQLGTKNNDECYTDTQDILNELSYWAELNKFQGKKIICPCDWDVLQNKTTKEYGLVEYKGKTYKNVYSITIEYDTDSFNVVGNNVYKCVKKVSFMGEEFDVDTSSTVETVNIDIDENEIEDFLRTKLTCNFVRTLTQNAKKWGIKSITASGYNPAIDKGVKFQDVDYSKYDICITNPPFSLYPEFIKCILGKIDFIVLAPFMNRNSPACGLPLMLKQAYLGKGVHLALLFNNPTKANGYNGTKSVACDWLVSWPDAQQERNNKHYKSGISYDLYKDEYIEMPNMTMKDETHPIRMNGSTYPDDYNGWMFAGVNILDNLDQDTYEWYGSNYKGYFNKNNMENSIFIHKADDKTMLMCADGKRAFHGVLFRKKPTADEE